MRSAFGDFRINRKAEIKHLTAQVEDFTVPPAIDSFHMIWGPMMNTQRLGCCRTAKVGHDEHGQSIPVVVETTQHQD